MRIAVNTLPVSSGQTGIGCYARELVDATLAFPGGNEFVYITGPDGTPGVPENQLLRISHPSRLWEHLHLPTELENMGADLYHSPLFACPIVKQCPSIITVHDAIPEARPDLCSEQFLAFYHATIGPALRACDYVVTVSEFSKNEIAGHLAVAPEKISVVHQAVSPRFSPRRSRNLPGLRDRLGLPDRYILYVGMVEPRKNVERLVRAFARISKHTPDAQMVIAGRTDDPNYSLDAVISETGVNDRVTMLGYVADEDMPALYAGAMAFAFPSLYEGFGRPIVEAMASGVPVVCANTTSLPEVAGGAALLVDPGDIDSIAEGLRRICTDDELREDLRRKGLERAEDFTPEEFAAGLLEVYKKMEAVPCG